MATFDSVWYVSSVGYAAVTAWAATTTKHCGDMVRQLATPAVNSERCFVCIASTSGTGQTGGSEPAGGTWTGPTRGQKTTDSGITWMEATGIAGLNGDLTNTPTWANTNIKNKAMSLGQVIQNVAGTLLLICTTAGTTGNGAEPSWAAATNAGATTADNTATWTTLGAPGNYAAWASPHARCKNGLTAGWGIDGNTIYLADNHAETQSATLSLGTQGGGFAVQTKFLSIDHTASLPPNSAALKSGASIATTGGSAINWLTGGNVNWYMYGITLSCGSGANAPALGIINGTNTTLIADSCSFSVPGTVGSELNLGNATTLFRVKIRLNNCTFNFGAAGSNINWNVPDAEWKNTPSAITGTAPTVLIGGSGNVSDQHLDIRGVDLSALGSGKTIFSSTGSMSFRATISDCKINSAVTLSTTPANAGQWVDFVRCDSGAHTYQQARYKYEGTLLNENTIVRSSGANDGASGVSWKITTSANSNWQQPFDTFPIVIWNNTTGANVTVTLSGITTQAALPNNDDLWIEVQYPGDSGSPLSSFANSTKTNVLASGSALSANTASDWAGVASAYQTAHAYGAFTGVIKAGNASPQQLWFMSSHSGTGTSGSDSTIFNGQSDGATVTDNSGGNQIVWQAMTRFKMSVTLSSPQPQLAGYFTVTVQAAKASSTFYIDPLIVLS
jgi:hypothetical protein